MRKGDARAHIKTVLNEGARLRDAFNGGARGQDTDPDTAMSYESQVWNLFDMVDEARAYAETAPKTYARAVDMVHTLSDLMGGK